MFKTPLISCAVASIVLAASSVSAQLVAYGSHAGLGNLVGSNPGTSGTSGLTNWEVQNSNAAFQVRAPGLAFPQLQTSGNSAYVGGDFLSAGFGLTLPQSWEGGASNPWNPWRVPGTDRAGRNDTTLWASMLVNAFTETPEFRISFHNDNIRWLEQNSSFRLMVDGGFWSMRNSSTGVITRTPHRVDPGKTELFVFKFDFADSVQNLSDTVSLYLNPTPGLASPNVTPTTYSVPNLEFRSIRTYPGQNRLSGAVDEIRFGGSYANVTPQNASATGNDFKRVRAYFIGNSVTDTINPNQLRQAALDRSSAMPWGRQVILGSPLDNIINNPNVGFTEAPYGGYTTALPNYSWDFLSFQPFDRNLTSDRASINTLINLAQSLGNNNDTQFAIYSRWPRKGSGTFDYQALWDRPYNAANPTGSQPEESRAFFEQLRDAVQQDQTDVSKPIVIVPVGDVMYELDKRLKANPLTTTNGVFDDVGDFYSDGIHLYNSYGAYLVAATFYSVMYKEDPANLSAVPFEQIVNNNPNQAYVPIDPVLLALMRDTIWDVVSVHPNAGVVPEPASMMVWGAAGVMLLRRKRQKHQINT
jgi:hypothetical protein